MDRLDFVFEIAKKLAKVRDIDFRFVGIRSFENDKLTASFYIKGTQEGVLVVHVENITEINPKRVEKTVDQVVGELENSRPRVRCM